MAGVSHPEGRTYSPPRRNRLHIPRSAPEGAELTHSVIPPLPTKAIRLCGAPGGGGIPDGPCALRGGCGSCGNLRPMRSAMLSSAQLADAVQGSSRQLSAKSFPRKLLRCLGPQPAAPFLLRKETKQREGDEAWRSTIWKQRSSAVAQAALRWRLRQQHKPIRKEERNVEL